MCAQGLIILIQQDLQPAVDDIHRVSVLIDLGGLRHDPYFIKGIDRNIGRAEAFGRLVIDAVPEPLPEFLLGIDHGGRDLL